MPFRGTTCTFPWESPLAQNQIVSPHGRPATCPFQASPAQIQILGSSPGIHGAIWRLASTHIVLRISLSEEAASKCWYKNNPFFLSFIWFFELHCSCVPKADWEAWERTVNKPISNLCPKYWLWLLIGVFRYRSKGSYWLPKDRISALTGKVGLTVCFTEKIHLGWPYVCWPSRKTNNQGQGKEKDDQ